MEHLSHYYHKAGGQMYISTFTSPIHAVHHFFQYKYTFQELKIRFPKSYEMSKSLEKEGLYKHALSDEEMGILLSEFVKNI
jgi:hypothetical protein